MKKVSKTILIFSCALFFAGLILALGSLALGANPNIVGTRLNSMGVSDVYFWGHQRFYDHYGNNYNYDYEYDYNYDNNYDYDYDLDSSRGLTVPLPAQAPEAPAMPLSPTVGEYDITSLYFDFDAGDINIIQGSDFALIYGNAQAERYFYESIDGSAWTIGSNKKWSVFDMWRHNGDKLKLTVVLPADFVAEHIDIYMGAGNMRADSLRAQTIFMDIGLGNCQIGEVLAQDADLNVGMGNLDMASFHADTALLEVGVGAMKLRLAQPLAEYRCNLQVGLGNVTLGGSSYSGVADISSGSADALYQMDVSCGMGSITVLNAANE